jgi:1-deoxy-D-xylulose-5-phosphate reductoisomerase
MGPKITVDSATLFNKGFEIIEASFLFSLPAERIEALIHPQSIIHSMVEFEDGSVMAQMSYPTMEIPIQYALTYPERKPTDVTPLDLASTGSLDFETPDLAKFPALALARRALEMGGTAPAALNLANDEAVQLFLDGKLPFTGIAETVKRVLDTAEVVKDYNYEDIISLKEWVSGQIRKWTQA